MYNVSGAVAVGVRGGVHRVLGFESIRVLDCPELVWLCGEYAEEVAVPDHVQVFLEEFQRELSELGCELFVVCRAGNVYKIFYHCVTGVYAVVVSDEAIERFVREVLWGS